MGHLLQRLAFYPPLSYNQGDICLITTTKFPQFVLHPLLIHLKGASISARKCATGTDVRKWITFSKNPTKATQFLPGLRITKCSAPISKINWLLN